MTDFDRAYQDSISSIFGFFAYRVASRDDAEDLTQLTFERALRAWGRYDPGRSQPLTWFMAIARNTLIDHYRSGGRNRNVPLEDMGGDEPAAEDALPLDLGLGTGGQQKPDLGLGSGSATNLDLGLGG